MNKHAIDQSTDPVGTETLDNISEAGRFNKWMYSSIAPSLYGEILEIGSGIGNISDFLLEDKDKVVLSDLRTEYCDYLSERFCKSGSLISVEQIDIADNDFKNNYHHLLNRFETVFALNVVEHIGNDNLAIGNCRNLLKEGGKLIILVPSYKWLFCSFDKELGHFRRYNRKTLSILVKNNGFIVDEMFHFNAFGVLGWLIFGKLLKRKLIKQTQMTIYNNLVSVFTLLDKLLFHRFGLSLVIIARK